jgi:diguanylate cyclase (GGDEF)-like protein
LHTTTSPGWTDSAGADGGQGAPSLSTLTPLSLRNSRVMLVDDDPLMTELVQGYLEEAGYHNFVVTNDPREALPLMHEQKPSVVLLDLMMPQMSGFEVLELVRREKALRVVPVIVLTAASDSDSKLRALQLGATDLLAKPVDESELLLRVRNTLAFRQFYEHTLNHDDVTGLPSRRQFARVATEKLAQAGATRTPCAVFIVNVRAWTQVRETMGQDSADSLAGTIAQRLQDSLRAFDARQPGAQLIVHGALVARLRGDEFGLLLPRLAHPESAEAMAKAVLASLAQPVTLNGQDIVPTPTIGIALSSSDGGTAEAVLQGAEQARSVALASGQPYVFFSDELNRRSRERLSEATLLRHAVERNELVLHYLPKVDMRSGEMAGVEAQLRWKHPTLGLVGPERFLGLAEELGLSAAIGEWMAYEACAEAARWISEGVPLAQVAIRIAPGHWRGAALHATLRVALQATQLAPGALCVSLTEGMLNEDTKVSLDRMKRIRDLGVTIAIDDFGSGQTSLGSIKQMPAQELRLDAALVQSLPGKADMAIARTVVTLGHSLGMIVVAKGVDSAEQLLALTNLEFDQFQGPLLHDPAPAKKVKELLRQAA